MKIEQTDFVFSTTGTITKTIQIPNGPMDTTTATTTHASIGTTGLVYTVTVQGAIDPAGVVKSTALISARANNAITASIARYAYYVVAVNCTVLGSGTPPTVSVLIQS